MEYEFVDITRSIKLLCKLREDIPKACAAFKQGDSSAELIEMLEVSESCNDVFFRISVLSRNLAAKFASLEQNVRMF